MDKNSADSLPIEAKKYALLSRALGLTRGVLYGVLTGDFTIQEVQEVLEVTSLKSLAEKNGYEEEDLAIDWEEYL